MESVYTPVMPRADYDWLYHMLEIGLGSVINHSPWFDPYVICKPGEVKK